MNLENYSPENISMMKKHVFTLAVLLLFFTSCVSVKELSKVHQQNKEDILTSEHALVYLIRPKLAGFAMPYPVFCDSANLGAITSKTYFYFSIPAGDHKFESTLGWPGKRVLNTTLSKGQAYYIRINSSANLEMMEDVEKAKGYLKKTRNYDKKTELKGGIIRFK